MNIYSLLKRDNFANRILGLHVQPRGTGVRLKCVSYSLDQYLTVLFVQGLFRLSGAFWSKFIEVINR